MEPRFQDDAARDLERVSRLVQQATRSFPVLGLILTGSVARGEGTLIADQKTGTRWLGDLECLLIVPPGWRTCTWQIDDALHGVETELNNDLGNRQRGLKVGITQMVATRLARLRRSIFNREFLEHGKLLWGTPSALPMPAWWAAGAHEVPVRDALRLLNNRTIQQITARMMHETGAAEPLSAEYAISKFWIELATSLSVFLDCYRTTYRARQTAIESLMASRPEILGGEFSELLVARLREAMAVKFGQTPKVTGPACQRFDEVARFATRVWYWESARMLGAGPDDSDWRLVISRLRRLETTSQRARDWMRLLMRDRSLRRLTPYTIRTMKAAARAGSLANAIYATGCLLLFFWDEIGLENQPGPQIAQTLGAFFDVQAGSGKERRLMLTQRVQTAWDRHLRSSAA
ncbi:MAG TPA: hypothetical protein VEJ67_03465 [Candidatus Cybelea sp.]|nr:hypothetical protein [Candidatus Cybelea sp.]